MATLSLLAENEASFGSRRVLVAVIGIVSALALCALAYFFLASPPEKALPLTAEVSLPVQSPPATSVEAAPKITIRDEAARLEPAKVPLSAPTTNTPSIAAPPREILFVQRPGINIRATPSKSGTVVGTAPKGMRLEVTNREGEWVQVNDGRLKAWINAQFLAPTQPR